MIAEFEAAKAKGEGAFRFEDKMVDEPVVARARTLLKRSNQ
jgi:citrate lyase beta subunit